MKKKGFPQSYDMHRLVKFVSDLKSGYRRQPRRFIPI
jgi:type I pantothenate kinase